MTVKKKALALAGSSSIESYNGKINTPLTTSQGTVVNVKAAVWERRTLPRNVPVLCPQGDPRDYCQRFE
jgi:hypothetical protein